MKGKVAGVQTELRPAFRIEIKFVFQAIMTKMYRQIK